MHRITFLLALITAAFAVISGCAHTDKPAEQSEPASASNGFTHGMPPSSEGPSATWYERRYNRPRGIGEAIKEDRRSLWDRDSGTFVYYVGGELYAQYHPWEHYLQIRADNKGASNLSCHWAADAALTMNADGMPIPADAEETCKQLLDKLEKFVTPSSVLSHKGP